jgi:polyisoprenoid-binding protein YceI
MSASPRWFPTILAALALGVALAPASAAAALKASGKPDIHFFAEGSPGALDIDGATNTLAIADDGTKIVFTVPMKSVSTGIDMRDEHMNEKFVQVEQFPNAILTINKADIQLGTTLGEEKSGTVSGTFNIHGADQPVTVTYNTKKSKTGWRAMAKFEFDVTKSGIAIPDYLGVTVDPKMHAEVKVDLIDG